MSEYRYIGSFSKVRRGASPRPIDNPLFFGGDVGWVRISDVTQRNNKFLKKTQQYLSPLGESKSLRVNSGDLIMSICATVGKPMIVDMAACIHDGFVQIYDLENADTEYLYYLLQFHEKDFEKRGQPGTQVNLNTTIVENERVFLPFELIQQQKIAKILSTVDNLIDQTQGLIDKYTAVKQGMMTDLFTRGIDCSGTPDSNANYGQLRPSVADAPELYQATELGWVPKAWEVKRLDSLLRDIPAAMRSGPFGSALLKHELVAEGIPLLGIDNIFSEHFSNKFKRHVTPEKFQELSRYAVRPKDVVITIMGTVGRCCVIPDDLGLALSSKHLWTMAFDTNKVVPELICWQLNYADWVKSWFDSKSQGGIMEAIQSQTLKTLLLPTPSLKEQQRILAIYLNLNGKIASEKNLLSKLQLKKKGLMQDLLTGKVRVN